MSLVLFWIGIKASAQGFGLSPHKEGERPRGNYSVIEENGGKWIGKDDKTVYLTFDCGYENGYTKDILNTLKNNNVKATFFITGHYLKSSKELVRIMINDGHIIGNHTCSHNDFTKSTSAEILNDVKSLEDAFYKEFNINMSKYVRPPRGEYNEESMKILNQNGYKNVFWSLAYVDWYKDKYYGNNYSYKKVMSKIHNGAVILMHTVGKDNKEDFANINFEYELVFVNDGSKDATLHNLKKLHAAQKCPTKVISFSRNFGKEAGIYAGMQHASGEYISLIDADLQQRPEIVRDMVKILDEDPEYDVVAAYQDRRGEGKVLSFFKRRFYATINMIFKKAISYDASKIICLHTHPLLK